LSVLEMAKTDPAGRKYRPTACVFGALGERLTAIKKAWEDCVLLAHATIPFG